MTERSFAIAAIINLQDAGWTLRSAFDGGERIFPTSATEAVRHVEAAETGSVRMSKGDLRVTLSMLFQGGEAGEVIYDYSSNGDMDEIYRIINLPR